MNRIRVLLLAGGLFFIALVMAWFEPGRRLVGWMQGEPFYQGRPSSWWVRQLTGADPPGLAAAQWTLRDDIRSIPLLVHVLSNDTVSCEARWNAADLLGQFGPKALEAVPHLEAWLEKDDPYDQGVAIRVLGEIGANDDTVCDRLTQQLDGSHRLAVLQSLGNGQGGSLFVVRELVSMVGFSNEPAEVALALVALNKRAKRIQELSPAIIARLNDRDSAVRQQAVELVGRVASPNPVLVEAIRLRLNDAHEAVRSEAIRTLGWFGPASRPALAELKVFANHSNPAIRKRAAQAIERIGSNP